VTIQAQLFDDKYVTVDDRTALLGGSFYYDPLRAYSPLPLKWAYEQLIRYPKAVLLDCGASTGSFSLLSAHHPDLTAYSFEPVELTYRILRENIYLNGLVDKVYPQRLGVSDSDGYDTLHTVIADGGKGVSIVGGKPAYHKAVEDSKIQTVKLDTFCELGNIVPTFIKIDTEGSELLVLQGAEETIKRYHPFLLFEHSTENSDQFGIVASRAIEMIEEWGYVWQNPEGMDIWATHKNWETDIK
jgi:FkbM family methyltransferase